MSNNNLESAFKFLKDNAGTLSHGSVSVNLVIHENQIKRVEYGIIKKELNAGE